jgi:acyl carrier protein
VQRFPSENIAKGQLTMNEIADKVTKIVADHLGLDPATLRLGASFADDLGTDSLDTVEVKLMLEEAFDLEIPQAEADKMHTIQDVVEYISEHTLAS